MTRGSHRATIAETTPPFCPALQWAHHAGGRDVDRLWLLIKNGGRP